MQLKPGFYRVKKQYLKPTEHFGDEIFIMHACLCSRITKPTLK